LRSGQTFDVVLTDIEMPDMNGFEFAESIRADQHLSRMPIIGLSSLVSPAAIERGRQAGFHDYVAKFRSSRPDRGAQGADRRDEPRGLTFGLRRVR